MPVQSGGGVIFTLKTFFFMVIILKIISLTDKTELSTLNCQDFSDWPKVLQEENRIIKIPLTCTKSEIVFSG